MQYSKHLKVKALTWFPNAKVIPDKWNQLALAKTLSKSISLGSIVVTAECFLLYKTFDGLPPKPVSTKYIPRFDPPLAILLVYTPWAFKCFIAESPSWLSGSFVINSVSWPKCDNDTKTLASPPP